MADNSPSSSASEQAALMEQISILDKLDQFASIVDYDTNSEVAE